MEEERLRQLWADARELNLGVSGEVDRLPSAPTALQFLRDYVSPNKPCIISTSATAHWPAISQSLWASDSYLLRALGDQPVSVHLTPTGRADSLAPHPSSPSSLCFASAHVRPMPFSAALRLISDASSPLVAYAQQQNDCFRSEYSALSGDVDPHIPWATEAFGGAHPDAVNLWIGNASSHTSFHKDHYENLYAVITGEKHFLLLPPTEAHRLYIRRYPEAGYKMDCDDSMRLELETPEREVPWCSVDPYPDTAEEAERQRREFPMYFEGPEPFRCTVRAGEILYLPSMWFHHVRQSPDANGRTIAVNYWYDMQFDIKYAYFNFLQSIDCLAIRHKDATDSRDDAGDSQLESSS